ncbi:MAG TPA: 2Fe-2S iron-sulfur cluster-binding protein, partial [Acidimicrobiia bacterium]|nr:2Fe-2S iron-sulfur cluster-binding protein [Acidimicrobiia bacterium]
MVELTLDGETVAVPEGSTILDACERVGLDIPTLCWGDTLRPKNACRVCMVEVEGARVLAPSCSRKVEPGMVVRTDSERARHARRLVLEFLGSSVDLSATPRVPEWNAEYGADPSRYGGERATVAQPAKVDNGLYVRDYERCILCYKCVDACGEQWQNTFAITVAGRGFDSRISTEWDVPLPDSA